MSIEIEIKAWADDWESVKNHIDAFADFTGTYNKADTYWIVPPNREQLFGERDSGIRVREASFTRSNYTEEHIKRVCFKKKERRTDMEVNVENEFDISDTAAFEKLMLHLGLVKGHSKQKKGWSWKYEDITIELSEIQGLGWFCELEIIAEYDDPDFTAQSRNRLCEVLQKTGIDSSRIESRYYMEMLNKK